MFRQEKKETFAIRKSKIAVGSVLIAMSALGLAIAPKVAHAAQGDTRNIEVTWLEENSFKELGKNQATSVDNGDGTFTTTFTSLDGHYAPKKVRLYQHELPNKINVVSHDWLKNVPEGQIFPNNNVPSDFTLGGVGIVGRDPEAWLINGDQLEGKKITPTFYFTSTRYADGSRGFTLGRALGTKSTITEKVLNATTRYEKDDTREKGQPNEVVVAAKNGKEITTTDYTFRKKNGSTVEPMRAEAVNPNELNNVNPDEYITENTKTKTEAPVNGVVKVAAKDKVVTEKIASPVRYEKDATREKGQPNIENKGKDGSRTTTTVYNVNSETGAITENVGTPVVTEATETVVKVAAKDKVDVKDVDFTTEYIKDDTREKGAENIVVKEGQKGSETTTTVYNVDAKNGSISETVGQPVKKEAVTRVVKVAAKDESNQFKQGTKTIKRTTRYEVGAQDGNVSGTTTDELIADTGDALVNDVPAFDESKIKINSEDIQPSIRYEKDDTRDKGQEDIVVKGEIGQKKITTVPVPDENGVEKDVVTEEVVKPAGETVVKVAAKTKVEVLKQGTKTIKRTTVYDVNPETGKVTDTVTDELIAEVSAEPPVVNAPEFNGGVNGESLVNEVPAFDESKIKITTEEIQPTVRYEKDDTRDKGEEDIIVKGEVGQKKVTTVPVPDENGIEKDVVTEEVVKPVGETVVKVAAKTKVETVKEDGKTIERSTDYDVNAQTGKITETVTGRVISKEQPKKEEVKAESPKVEVVPADFTAHKQSEAPKVEAVSTSQPATPKVEAVTQNKKAELPNTGTANNVALTIAGVTILMGTGAMLLKKEF